MDAGSCNACHATGTPLMKFSLGKDFFGRTYDRLSPASDQSPKWYCDPCSMMKHLQRDFRDIHAEFDKLAKGQASALSEPEAKQRASCAFRKLPPSPERRPSVRRSSMSRRQTVDRAFSYSG